MNDSHHGGVYALTHGELEQAKAVIGDAYDSGEALICVDTDETARLLSVSPKLVALWRRSGIGPKYFHVNPEQDRTMVLYPVQGILDWVEDGVRKQQARDAKRVADYRKKQAQNAAKERRNYAKRRAAAKAAAAAAASGSEKADKQGR